MCKNLADQLSKPINTFNFYRLSIASLQEGTVPEKATPLPYAVIVPKHMQLLFLNSVDLRTSNISKTTSTNFSLYLREKVKLFKSGLFTLGVVTTALHHLSILFFPQKKSQHFH